MGIRRVVSFYTGLVILLLAALAIPTSAYAQTCRDPLQQPFAATSIWNTPIGSNAQFVPADFTAPSSGYVLEENIIITDPSGPMKTVQESASSGWDGVDRCQTNGSALYGGKQFPIPANFTTNDLHEGGTPNASGAIYSPDDDKFYQNQPLMICGKGGTVTSKYQYPTIDAKGDGIQGAQGGSGMSSIGGTIRISEMKAGYRIPHALKLIIYGIENISKSGGGYRWPAVKADSGFDTDPCGTPSNAYCGNVPELKMGALLALPPSVDINSLGLTSPSSKMIAQALQEYGAYVVDNSAWPNAHIAVEFGPAGSGVEVFNSQVGPLNDAELNKVFTKLAVVNNNTPTSIGGGGTPTAPTALPFCDGSGGGGGGGGGTTPTTPPGGGSCATKSQGDADCKNGVSLADFAIWKTEYSSGSGKTADFNANGSVTLADFQIWRNTYVGSGGGTNPTAVPTTPPGGGGGSITKPIKVVGIGDSITGLSNAWTYALQDRMKAGSCTAADYQFIGYDQEFPNPDSEPYASRGPAGYQHQRISRGGFNARGMLNVVKDQGFGGTPDVVMTYLSVNNEGQGYVDGTYNPPGDGNPATMKQDLKEMIQFARTKNPKVTVILGTLQDNFGVAEIKALATEMDTSTSHVYATDPPSFGGGDVHSIPPDNIAVKMYEKLKPVLDANGICN